MMKTYLDLLQTLIREKPITALLPNVNTVTEILRSFAASHACHTAVESMDGREILYISNCGADIPDVLLNAHVDVVPADDNQFNPYIQDDRMFGRGTADCLGNAVCALRSVIESPSNLKIAAVFSSDEEAGGKTTAVMVERGYTAKHAILVLDNSEENIIFSQKGILTVKMTADGKSGHAAYPWQCDNPVETLMRAYLKFRDQWTNPVDEYDWRSSLAPCVLSAGNADNRIPESASVILNFRFVQEEEHELILKSLRDITACRIEPMDIIPPVSFPQELPIFHLIQTAMEKHNPNHKYPLERLCGATDARHWKLTGVPVAITGIIGYNIHSQNESVEISSIRNTSDAVIEFASRIADIEH